MVAETEAETQSKNDNITSVTYGFNPLLQVYQPQIYGILQEQLVAPQIYGLHSQQQVVVAPQNYALHCQEQFVAPQVYGHQPQVYQPCVYFGKNEAEAELDFEAEAEANAQYLSYIPYASAFTAGYSFGAYHDGYYGYGLAGVFHLDGYPSTYNTVNNGQGRRPPGF